MPHHLRAQTADNVGNWAGWKTLFTFRYDATPPANPTSVTETHGVANDTWQKNVGDPNFTWSGASDGGSGVAGYEVYWGTSSSGTSPATWRTSASYNPSAVPSETTYYLRVRTKDNAGNWAGWKTLFTFRYDATPPTNPTGVTEVHGVLNNTWQKNVGDPEFTWSGAGDGGSGVAG